MTKVRKFANGHCSDFWTICDLWAYSHSDEQRTKLSLTNFWRVIPKRRIKHVFNTEKNSQNTYYRNIRTLSLTCQFDSRNTGKASHFRTVCFRRTLSAAFGAVNHAAIHTKSAAFWLHKFEILHLHTISIRSCTFCAGTVCRKKNRPHVCRHELPFLPETRGVFLAAGCNTSSRSGGRRMAVHDVLSQSRTLRGFSRAIINPQST